MFVVADQIQSEWFILQLAVLSKRTLFTFLNWVYKFFGLWYIIAHLY